MIAISLFLVGIAGQAPATAVPPHPRSAPTNAQARSPLARYVSNDLDYPAAALRDGAEGRVAFALAIGPDGRVQGCRITQSSGSATLDSATCRIMRSRARYAPALDARGVAVAGADIGAIIWRLPRD